MKRGSTPVHVFELPFNVDIIEKAKVIYRQHGQIVLTKCETDFLMAGNTIMVSLSQEESFLFDCTALADAQIRVLSTGGDAYVSDHIKLHIGECSEEEVME